MCRNIRILFNPFFDLLKHWYFFALEFTLIGMKNIYKYTLVIHIDFVRKRGGISCFGIRENKKINIHDPAYNRCVSFLR